MSKPLSNKFSKASFQKGGALIYILIAVALLAALTSTMIGDGGQSSRTQNSFRLGQELNSQSRVIRSAIQDCVLRFTKGDAADIAEADYNNPYPLNPSSTEFTSPAADDKVSRLQCPGTSATSGATGNDDYHDLFGGSGEFAGYLPPKPDLMDDWTYFNGDATVHGVRLDGVYFQITSDKSDPQIGESMDRIDNLMASCEVDYIDGTGSNSCENGTKCLRYWIIRGANTAATGGPNPCP